MRVLHVTVRADGGGGPESIYHLVADRGDRVKHYIACPNEMPYWQRFASAIGVQRIVQIPHRRLTVPALWRLAKFCRQAEIDLIHSHGFGAGLYSRFVGRMLGIPVLHSFHGFHLHKKGGIKLILERLAQLWTAAYIAVSNSEGRAAAAALGIPPSHLITISNGVDTDRFRPCQESRTDDDFVILAVSRLAEEKNPLDLLRVLHLFLTMYPGTKARLLIAGDGPLRLSCEEEATRLRVRDRLSFLGWLDSLDSWLPQADVYVSTSHGEGMPRAMLEAMSCGLPVVATRVQGHTDLVAHGSTGFLFDEGHLGEAVKYLHRLEIDRDSLRRMAVNSRETILRSFTSEQYIERHDDLYLRLHNGNGRILEAGKASESA